MAVARPAAYAQLALVGLAFATLTWAFVAQDRSFEYVAQNSNSLLPLVYRVYTAVWGAHEGSLLLWLLVLALWTAAVARFSRRLPQDVVARVLGVLGIVSLGFLALLLFTSDPFERLLPMPAGARTSIRCCRTGHGRIHPPMLYVGYVGSRCRSRSRSPPCSKAASTRAGCGWTRPWTNAAWGFLTLGIALGSAWTYYELGWGGWWFWDPVENASFMPWLAGAALLHSQAVTEKRGSFWPLDPAAGHRRVLAVAARHLPRAFGRDHQRALAFAADPTRGVFILATWES